MRHRTIKKLWLAAIACLAMSFATNAMAFSIGVKPGDVMQEMGESREAGLSWWNAFQNRFPRARLPNRDTVQDQMSRPVGDWFRMHRTGAARGELPDKIDIALVGIDRETRIMYFKQQIFRKLLVSRRLNSWLAQQASQEAAPQPVPLPAPLLLMGSALLTLATVRRRLTWRRG